MKGPTVNFTASKKMADNGGESQVVGVGDTIQISFGHNEQNTELASTRNQVVRQRHHFCY